jgi:hypothetical protein
MNASLIISSVTLLAVLATACGAAPSSSVATTIPVPAPLPAASTPAITVVDQDARGGFVTIARLVTADVPTWVVIHAHPTGALNIVGTMLLQPGVYTDLTMPIDLAHTSPDVIAMLHTDGGTLGTWEDDPVDPPLQHNGQSVYVAFRVILP